MSRHSHLEHAGSFQNKVIFRFLASLAACRVGSLLEYSTLPFAKSLLNKRYRGKVLAATKVLVQGCAKHLQYDDVVKAKGDHIKW